MAIGSATENLLELHLQKNIKHNDPGLSDLNLCAFLARIVDTIYCSQLMFGVAPLKHKVLANSTVSLQSFFAHVDFALEETLYINPGQFQGC